MKDKLWSFLLSIALIVVGAVLNSAAGKLDKINDRTEKNEHRIIAIENSRMTTQDGLQIQTQLSQIKESMARIETRLEMKKPNGGGG